jgi:hypothetical protein
VVWKFKSDSMDDSCYIKGFDEFRWHIEILLYLFLTTIRSFVEMSLYLANKPNYRSFYCPDAAKAYPVHPALRITVILAKPRELHDSAF